MREAGIKSRCNRCYQWFERDDYDDCPQASCSPMALANEARAARIETLLERIALEQPDLLFTLTRQRELIAALAGALGRLIDNYGDRDVERCPMPLDECSLCNAVEVLTKVRANQPA